VAGQVPAGSAQTAERRVCSVLFADLVGFTTISEGRDVEVVRDLLSAYFDVARTVIGRYGGVVEKFIGDAVMAVWGVPLASADDSERAVRAGLELVDAVAALGETADVPGLAARAGVVTAEVAVTLGAVGQGMVAGDPVNTAARVQSAAAPGTVLVDEATRSLTRAAIDYADVGELRVKGKALGVPAWRALRTVAGVGGTDRVDGLYAPFLGRDRELRLVKEYFHATTDGGGARLVAVSGVAGSGKSRLCWEFESYVDGLQGTVLWHRGQCLSYGDGVAFWALAQIVRQRCGIAEAEPAQTAEPKLNAALERYVADPSERDYISPRLGALLGLASPDLDRQELYAGWRLFLQRLADTAPVVLVIEDMQYADDGLLEFLDLLLDWLADHPIFLLTLARPEFDDKHPGWAQGRSNVSPLALTPIPNPVMTELLTALVADLTPDLQARIVERAAGVPLFAVEMVRSLIDHDVVIPVDGAYCMAPDAAADDLQVPATLTVLIAARIDALSEPERRLLHGLAVLGGSFPREAITAVTDLSEAHLDPLLASLRRRDLLSIRADRLSPERGQYAFTQPLLRQVAYDTLSRRDRVALHERVATHLRETFPDDGAEIAEIVAAHYADALALATDPADQNRLRDLALTTYIRAGDRSLAIGAPDAAVAAYLAAAALAADERQRADLTGQAGLAAYQLGRYDAALEYLEEAIAAHNVAGRLADAGRLMPDLARALSVLDRISEATERLTTALADLDAHTADPTVCAMTAELARGLNTLGRVDEAAAHIDRAFLDAQALNLPHVLAGAFQTRAWIQIAQDRPVEALFSIEAAITIAHDNDLGYEEGNAQTSAAIIRQLSNLPGVEEHIAASLAIARRRGDRAFEAISLSNISVGLFNDGRWDEISPPNSRPDGLLPGEWLTQAMMAMISARRGEDASPYLYPILDNLDSENPQSVLGALAAQAEVELRQGDPTVALGAAKRALELGYRGRGVRGLDYSLHLALAACLELGDLDEADEMLSFVADHHQESLPPDAVAYLHHYRARLNAERGVQDGCEEDFLAAIATCAEMGLPYELAEVRVPYASWLADQGRAEDALEQAGLAIATFERLRATPALREVQELVDRLAPKVGATNSVHGSDSAI
jgi:class 3 adenylate cyclase/tetratricopeptide (TPR) repeat protein